MDVDRYPSGSAQNLFQPQVVLPSQHFNDPEKRAPEQRLMIAVLDDAVRCIEKYRFATNAKSRRLFDEARRWLLATDSKWPYSFERICAVLDLDPNSVRRRLRLLADASQPRPRAAAASVVNLATTKAQEGSH